MSNYHRSYYGRAEPRQITLQNLFSRKEVGYSHPDNDSYIRINNAGDIEVVSGAGAALIISAQGDLTFMADEIHMVTKPGNTIRWNMFEFNETCTLYSQPTLLPYNISDRHNLYGGTYNF